MDRHSITYVGLNDSVVSYPSASGEWVKYEDVVDELTELHKDHKTQTDCIVKQHDEIAELQKRNYHLENTRLKESNTIQADAIEKMVNYFKNDLFSAKFESGSVSISVDVIREYVEQLKNDCK